jgi:Zn-dependent peptidase ImmA (M78 family)
MALAPEDVVVLTGKPLNRLLAWESGSAEPDVDDLEVLAHAYGRSIDYFLSERPETPNVIFLRATHSLLAPHLSIESRRMLAVFEELCRFEWELEGLSELPNVVGFTTHSNGHTADQLADIQRQELEITSKPIKDLRSLLGRLGVRVFLLDIPGSEFSGLSWWHTRYGPSVLVNSSESPGRRNFTMAHEFGHLLTALGNQITVCDLSDIEVERFANRFAVAFLMPQDDVVNYWLSEVKENQIVDVELLAGISKRYGVSLEALAIRLEELRLLPNATWMIERAPKPRSFGRRRPNWRRTRGERFLRKAAAAYGHRTISLGKLAEYLGTDLRTAKQTAEEF